MALDASGTVTHINIVTDGGRRFTFTLEDAVKLVEQLVPLLVERGWEFAPCPRCGSVTDVHGDESCLVESLPPELEPLAHLARVALLVQNADGVGELLRTLTPAWLETLNDQTRGSDDAT